MTLSRTILLLLVRALFWLALCSLDAVEALPEKLVVVGSLQPALPDLVITDLWDSGSAVCYQVRNAGESAASAGHSTQLYVDGEPAAVDLVGVSLSPGARLNRCFSYGWQCTGSADSLVATADALLAVPESDEKNNTLEEGWACDTISPRITSGPNVSSITTDSALVSWLTDEATDSLVRFGRQVAAYEGEESSTSLSTDHELALHDLKPGSTYHYVVQSRDAGGNTITSREAFFETAQVPDTVSPTIDKLSVSRGEGDFLHYNVSAIVTDDIGVERVEFYMDDQLIGIDYASSGDGAQPVYELVLIPSAMGMTLEEFAGQHVIEAVAFDSSESSRMTNSIMPPYECADIELQIESPYPDQTLYIDDSVTPPGTMVPIGVYGAEVRKDCEPGLVRLPSWGRLDPCEDLLTPMSHLDFYVNTILECTDSPSHSGDYFYDCEWDASGLGPGTFAVRVDAFASPGCAETAIRHLVIAIGERRLEVHREVTRLGNYFEVQLTVQNAGTLSQELSTIQDRVTGLQPIHANDTAGHYHWWVTSDCGPDGQLCAVEIQLSTDTGSSVVLAPGEEITVGYDVVPVLYSEPVEYTIGAEPVRILDFPGSLVGSFERPCVRLLDGTELSRAVPTAQEASDYLIVTNPGRISAWWVTGHVTAFNRLLSDLAELASLRNGILGYLSGPESLEARTVDDQIERWGSSMRGSDGTAGAYLSNGYLLLVGEQQFVPALAFSYASLPWNWDMGNIGHTDMHYADTSGAFDRPELSTGRIVGGLWIEDLAVPIQASIDIARGDLDFDNSHAYAVSGQETGPSLTPFVEQRISVAATLRDKGYAVEEDDHPTHTTLFDHAQDRDIILLAGHGSPTTWDGIGSGTVGTEFSPGSARPFVYASSCSTGQYATSWSIAEAFLLNGASAYVGATEDAVNPWGSRLAEAFFDRLEVGTTVGLAMRDAKRHRWGANTWAWDDEYNRYNISIYHLYGDPKLEPTLFAPSTAARRKDSSSSVGTPASQALASSLGVTIPEYEVKSGVAGDRVEIPGGGLVMEPGRPSVPSFSVHVEYQAGVQVQGVALTGREALYTDTGLDIPEVFPSINGDQAAPNQVAGNSSEWWPDRDFNWVVEGDPLGTSTLTIEIYPFYYNPATTNVEFYRRYEFDIDYAISTVEIQLLTTDRDSYPQGDDVLIDLWLSNSGEEQDVLVSGVVMDEGHRDIVDGLLLQTLQGLTGSASLSLQWDSSGHAAGYYAIEVTVRDTAGQLLDKEVRRVRLGICSGNIIGFSATPRSFSIGEEIDLSLAFLNSGTVPITGTAVIEVQDWAGDVVEEFRHAVSGLPPANPVAFFDSWDTSGAQEGSYYVLGYVMYDGKATSPVTTFVTTNPPVYLPTVLRASG